MKITDDALNQIYDGITFDAHEQVPFFVVDEDSVLVINDVEVNVIENYCTRVYDGVTYAKMGSNHKNHDGTFSGMEPTYDSTVESQWSELGPAISAQTMMNVIRKVAAMTAEEYRDENIVELVAEQDNTFISFDVELNGQVLTFAFDTQKKFELQNQIAMLESGALKLGMIHDVDFANEEKFTLEQMYAIFNAMVSNTTQNEFGIGALIKRLKSLEGDYTKGDVDDAVSMPLTDEEQAEVMAHIVEMLGTTE